MDNGNEPYAATRPIYFNMKYKARAPYFLHSSTHNVLDSFRVGITTVGFCVSTLCVRTLCRPISKQALSPEYSGE